MLTSRIRNTNTDGKSFTFTFAYHTYLYVTDIRFCCDINMNFYILMQVHCSDICDIMFCLLIMFSEVRIEGLETLDYLDNLKNRERFTEQGDAITFESEVSICYQWHNSFIFNSSSL
jgi:glucose-6-phosphate 1-epimerase